MIFAFNFTGQSHIMMFITTHLAGKQIEWVVTELILSLARTSYTRITTALIEVNSNMSLTISH